MPVDFFINVCKTSTSEAKFGLCDDNPPPQGKPAYIDIENAQNWIAEVENSNEIIINFHAIDNCIEIFRPNGERESRCDCMLNYNNSLVFIELKNKTGSGWLSGGSNQLAISINKFKECHNINDFDNVEAYICNKQRPLAIMGTNSTVQKFKDKTGLYLKTNREIKIK